VAGLELPAGFDVPAEARLDPADRRRRRSVRWLVVTAAAAAFLGLAFYLREVFNPFLVALLLAYMLDPVVEALERRGFSRQKAVVGLFAAVLLATSGVLTLVTVKAAVYVEELVFAIAGERRLDPEEPRDAALIKAFEHPGEVSSDSLALLVSKNVRRDERGYFLDRDDDGERRVGLAEEWSRALATNLAGAVDADDLQRLADAARSHASQILSAGSEVSQGLRRSVQRIRTFFSYLLLVPLYTFFLLQSFPALRDAVRDHLPGAYRARVVTIAAQIDREVAAFFRGRLILALAKGVVTWIGFAIIGVPFSFFVGMGAGLLSVVPFLGPITGGGAAVALSFSPEGWLLQVVLILVVLAVAEVVEAVGQPVVLGREVGLDPLVLLLSFFVFGELFGLFGVLLAVPIASVVKVLFRELLLPEIEALAREPGPRLPAEPEPEPADAAAGGGEADGDEGPAG